MTALPLPSDVLIKTQHNLEEKLKNGPANYNQVRSNDFIFHENISFIMKVYPGIILANGDTVKDFALVKKLRVSHILNAAEGHVRLHKNKNRTFLALTGAQVVNVLFVLVGVYMGYYSQEDPQKES